MKKNLFFIMIANIFYLLVVAGINFILPKFTSIETYAATKEYTLYLTTYSSILTFGYLQGMYVEYGGKQLDKINPYAIAKNFTSFLILMLPISLIILVIGVCIQNIVITVLGIGILSTNLQNYYQMLYQATGEFKAYSIALNFSRVALLAVYLILIFIFKTDNLFLFVIAAPVVGIVSALYLTIKSQQNIKFLKYCRFSIKTVIKNIRGGFVLMLGDFVTKFFSSLDRWFVKALMDTFSFAMYSFAVSMDNLVNTFMTPVTVSMFNYFCEKPSVKEIYRIKEAALIYSFLIIAGAYPAKWILENFMTEYISSSNIIFPLFAAQGLSAIIKGIYVNKYKAEGEQKKYLFQIIGMLILAAVLNVIFYAVYPSTVSFAIATLITNVLWLILCELQSKDIRYSWQAAVSIVSMLFVYVLTGYVCNSIIGCIIYCIVGILVGTTLMHDSFFFVLASILETIKKKLGRKG